MESINVSSQRNHRVIRVEGTLRIRAEPSSKLSNIVPLLTLAISLKRAEAVASGNNTGNGEGDSLNTALTEYCIVYAVQPRLATDEPGQNSSPEKGAPWPTTDQQKILESTLVTMECLVEIGGRHGIQSREYSFKYVILCTLPWVSTAVGESKVKGIM